MIRDAIVFTNDRILFVDKQGTTGKKTSFKSIYLMNIVDVKMETVGFGFDDNEIKITYLMNVKKKVHAENFEMRKFEFPKTIEFLSLYKYLGTLALNNRKEINVGK